MKGLIRGAAGLAAVLAMSACNKDETVDLMGPPTAVQATPASVILADGDSTQVLVRLVNDRNQATPTSFTISNVSPTLVVKYDDKFRPDYTNGDTLVAPVVKPEQRYFVLGVGLGVGQFDITSNGLTKTVKVTVMPGKLKNIATVTSPALGDTITVTAPAGTRFTEATRFVSARGSADSAARIVTGSFSADSTTVKIIPQPSLNGPLTVTNLVLLYNPAIPVNRSYPTAQNFVTTAFPTSLGAAALNTTNPPLGGPVTVTAPTDWRFLPTAVVTVENGPNTPVPVIVSRSADSTQITFIPIPGTVAYTGRVFVTNVVHKRLPFTTYTRQIPTTQQLTVLPPPPSIASVVANPNLSLGQTTAITITGWRFRNNTKVTIGGVEAGLTNISADSMTAVITPFQGATSGTAMVFSNISLAGLPSVPLTATSSQAMTVAQAFVGVADPNATSIATATQLPFSDLHTTVVNDAGGPWVACTAPAIAGSKCRYYKVTLSPAAATAISGEIHWIRAGSNIDLGLYLINTANTSCLAFIADDLGATSGLTGDHGTSANCSTGAAVTVAAGTYILAVVNFSGGDPSSYSFRFAQP